MKFALPLTVVGVLALSNNAEAKHPRPDGKSGCQCTGVCKARGDPHIMNIYGETWIEKQQAFTLYSNHGFHVTADTFGEFFMKTVSFGGETISSSSCESNGAGTLQSLSHNANGDHLHIKVSCAKPTDTAKYGNDWHLDIDEFQITSFSPVGEASSQASGLCMTHHTGSSGETDKTDKVVFSKVPAAKCSCSALCMVQGDPHLTSFAGKQEKLTQKKLTLYEYDGYSISAQVGANDYIEQISTSDGQSWDVKDCSKRISGKNEKNIGKFSHKSSSKGNVNGVVNCAIESQGKYKGTPYLNFYITKTDEGSAATFQAMEVKASSGGVCTDGINTQ
jgi:hypothetical protein